jgi:hypothetical protein
MPWLSQLVMYSDHVIIFILYTNGLISVIKQLGTGGTEYGFGDWGSFAAILFFSVSLYNCH